MQAPPLLAAANQHLDQRPDRSAAVRHVLLRRQRRLAERLAEVGREEQRVVAKPALAARRREDAALAGGLDELRLGVWRLEERDDRAVARGAALGGQAREPLEQERVVRRLALSRA